MDFLVYTIAKKFVQILLLNFSVHAKVDQMASVNVPA